MSLKIISLKRTYSSDYDNILYDFYIPVLSESVEYYRLAGFFSSTSLAIAARGILGLIKNGGIMRIIVCPRLTKEDLNVIVEAQENPEKYIEMKMLKELDQLEDAFIQDHVLALGWMVANNKLQIKVAILYNERGVPLSYDEIQASGIFHQKVGILKDKAGNIVTFSGSINETAFAWTKNIEEFKVFRSWIPTEVDYVNADFQKFNRFWNNLSQKVKVIDIPYAVQKKLISIAPKDIEEICLQKWYKQLIIKKKKLELYSYQKDAINSWLNNNMQGIFEMATGTGKTFTCLGCVDKIFTEKAKVLVIITCPYQHLVNQWKNQIEEFGLDYDKIILAYSGFQWKHTLADSLIDLDLGYIDKLIVLTTHRTFSSQDFIEIIQKNKKNFYIFLVADEVHWLGAEKSKRGLIEQYDFKLGLSATPKRWFDDFGTKKIYEYFGNVVYEFSLKEAITKINPATGKTYLTPYRYIPKFVSLTEEELEEYFVKTVSIALRYNKVKNEEERDKILEALLFARADIIKNARQKYEVLKQILDGFDHDINYTIIYCNPQQIDEVMKIVNQKGIISHRFTMEEGVIPEEKYNGISQREYILQKFAEGEYKVLVAMKCLDEGVDIPPAKTAILMANSGNPREYIQRIGRILRRYPGKEEAVIYDIIVAPSLNNKAIPLQLRELEWKIFTKELKRYEEIAKIAINNAEALKLIDDIKKDLGR
ncbi:MAG TPA: DEAD/DEAH box helicase family protein [Tissierellaceae bacterium]